MHIRNKKNMCMHALMHVLQHLRYTRMHATPKTHTHARTHITHTYVKH